jgi:hypothetical protein
VGFAWCKDVYQSDFLRKESVKVNVFKQKVERRKIISIIGFVFISLFTIVMIPISSAKWNETLQINGDLNTGLFGGTPSPQKPTISPFSLTATPSQTISPTMTAISTQRATPTSFEVDYTLETQIILTKAATLTARPWPTQTPISPTRTKNPVIDPTAIATNILPSPHPTLVITDTVEIHPTPTVEPPTALPPLDLTPSPEVR